MGKTIMLQGTMANVGKSMLSIGMCRAFSQDGYKVAPFCAQSMVTNTYITKNGKEISKMQAMQSEAAGVEPDPYMNPILFKPTKTMGSRIILNGEMIGVMSVAEYMEKKKEFTKIVLDAFHELESGYDIVVMEGAGSPVEIDLQKHDIVNMGLAKKVGAPVLLVGDIDRGGVMAQLLGTLSLFTKIERSYVKGLIFNKFRGMRNSLEHMIQVTEQKGKVPVIGVAPYVYATFEDEHTVQEHYEVEDNVSVVEVVVIKLPHMTDYVDFNPFECLDEVVLKYAQTPAEIGNPDIIMIPETSRVYADLMWIRQNGMETRILQHAAKGTAIFGICGGLKLLGEQIDDPKVGMIYGMNLLPIRSSLGMEKEENASGCFGQIEGILSGLSGTAFADVLFQKGNVDVVSYCKPMMEIKQTSYGFQKENVYGVSVKNLFNNDEVLNNVVKSVLKEKGNDVSKFRAVSLKDYKEKQYNYIANLIRSSFDMDLLYQIIQDGIDK